MKIIAASNDKYICEVSFDELAQINGFSSAWARKDKIERRELPGLSIYKIGDEVPVSEWWRFVHDMRADENKLRGMAETMNHLAEMIRGAWPAITSPLTFKKDEQS